MKYLNKVYLYLHVVWPFSIVSYSYIHNCAIKQNTCVSRFNKKTQRIITNKQYLVYHYALKRDIKKTLSPPPPPQKKKNKYFQISLADTEDSTLNFRQFTLQTWTPEVMLWESVFQVTWTEHRLFFMGNECWMLSHQREVKQKPKTLPKSQPYSFKWQTLLLSFEFSLHLSQI